MSSIEEFNQIHNQASKRREIWKTYRKDVTSYILHFLTNKNSEILKTLIIGAGNCDDIDLSMIQKTKSHIYLSDVDSAALNHAVKSYQIDKQKTTILQTEFTGLFDSLLWNDFVNNMLKLKTKQEIDEELKRLQNRIKNYSFLKEYQNQFDLIIVTPIYTQLLYQQLVVNLSVLESVNYSSELINHINDSFLHFMPTVIQQFNQNTIALLSNRGTLVVMSDIYEVQNDTPLLQELHEYIIQPEQLDSYQKKYLEKYGYGFGDFGLYHLEETMNLKTYKWFEWPFSKEKTMFVKVEIFEPKGGEK